MDFIFWQNALSIHQSAFLRSLANKHQVLLVVENKQNPSRKSQGWFAPDFGTAQILTSPTEIEIQQILQEYNNSMHIFSGFGSISLVKKALTLAVKKKLKCMVMVEPFNQLGWKGKIRYIQYRTKALLLNNKIDALLVTGEMARKQYTSTGFNRNKVFSWGYFTECNDTNVSFPKNSMPLENSPAVLFIGQLIPRKNVLLLVKKMMQLIAYYNKFTLVGSGILENQIKVLISGQSKIIVKGSLSNNEVKQLLLNHDLLVLPSRFDGWGAVVNEALQAGTPVIASENCGAASLLDGEIRGDVFSFSDKNNMEMVLKKWLRKGKVTPEKRRQIYTWSEQNISGQAAAEYFIEIVNYITSQTSTRPEAPWIKNRHKHD